MKRQTDKVINKGRYAPTNILSISIIPPTLFDFSITLLSFLFSSSRTFALAVTSPKPSLKTLRLLLTVNSTLWIDFQLQFILTKTKKEKVVVKWIVTDRHEGSYGSFAANKNIFNRTYTTTLFNCFYHVCIFCFVLRECSFGSSTQSNSPEISSFLSLKMSDCFVWIYILIFCIKIYQTKKQAGFFSTIPLTNSYYG